MNSRIYVGNKGEILYAEDVPEEYLPANYSSDPNRIPYEGCVFLFIEQDGQLLDSMMIKSPVEEVIYPEKVRYDPPEYDSVTGEKISEGGAVVTHYAGISYLIDPNKPREHITDEELSVILGKPVKYKERPIHPNKVREEAQRRMIVLLNARDVTHLNLLINNGNREAIRLINKKVLENIEWSAEEEARVIQLRKLDAAIEAIRAASNSMEENPPQDYRDDSHWPKFLF